jgi:hypothetical protein
MRKRTNRILICIGILLVSLGVVYAVMLARATARLREAYAALEKDGRPMQAAAFIPPPVPDAQNAAVLYEKAASLLKNQPVGSKSLLWRLDRLADVVWSDSPDPCNCAELKQLMGQEVVRSALAAVEEAAQRPACRFNRHYDTGVPSEMPFLDDLRPFARILAVRAYWEAEAGAPDKAWATAATPLKLATGLREDPLCDAQLCSLIVVFRACLAMQRLCEIAPLHKENCEKIEGLLRNLDDPGPLLRAADGERLLVGERLFNLPTDELYQQVRTRVFLVGDHTPEILARLGFRIIIFKPRFVADHAMYLMMMGKLSQMLQDPYVPRGSGSRAEFENLRKKARILTGTYTPMFDFVAAFSYRASVQLRLTRAGLALLQYRQAHGAFPPTLEALGLPGLTDPYTQQPLHYRPEGEGFIVYSVGEDQKDNGGAVRQRRQETDYDIVWRYPRPAGGDS